MKVTLGNETYLMHWETRKFNPKKGNNTELELEATDCIIRRVVEGGKPWFVNSGHVSQTAGDQANSVIARRLSFLKAIHGLDRLLRKALGHEYNRTCRVTSGRRSMSQKNQKLRKRILMLEKELQGIKDLTSAIEEVNKENVIV